MTDTKEINHEIKIPATPSAVFESIISSEKHSAFTGAPAEFEDQVGGNFSTFNGVISGNISKLEKDSLIELNWRAGGFPEGYYTKVRFELKKSKNGTVIKFTHSGVPAEAVEMITEGWYTNYWKKLPEYFSK